MYHMLGTNLQRIKIHQTQSVLMTQKALQNLSEWLLNAHDYHWTGE